MDKVAILIPCYNEAATIDKVVRDWKTALPGAVIYVYDNNSTDHTDEIARTAGRLCAMNTSRARAMLSVGCFRR